MNMEKWFEILNELEDRRKGTHLHETIYNEILVKGEQWTKKKAKQFEPSVELFGKIMMAHIDYQKHGPFSDMFGAFLEATENNWKRGGQFLTPENIVKLIVEMTMGDDKKKLLAKPQMILDPAAGTGRFMLGTAQHFAKTVGQLNFIFFNIDIDFIVYVYCAMNAILYGIPSVNILGDTLTHKFREGIGTIPIGQAAMWKMLSQERVTQIMGTAEQFAAQSHKTPQLSLPTPSKTMKARVTQATVTTLEPEQMKQLTLMQWQPKRKK
jgi:type I restriction-modification system DNA methylase subunit